MTPAEARNVVQRAAHRMRGVLRAHAPHALRWLEYDLGGVPHPPAVFVEALVELALVFVRAELGAKEDAAAECEAFRAGLTLADVPDTVPAAQRANVLAGARQSAAGCRNAVERSAAPRAAKSAELLEAMTLLRGLQ